jgi:hypothetical protein
MSRSQINRSSRRDHHPQSPLRALATLAAATTATTDVTAQTADSFTFAKLRRDFHVSDSFKKSYIDSRINRYVDPSRVGKEGDFPKLPLSVIRVLGTGGGLS